MVASCFSIRRFQLNELNLVMIVVFVNIVRQLSSFAGLMAAGMISLSILVVCQLVFMRYVLNAPTTWQTELVTYLLVSATLIGSPYVLKIGGHVSVDLLPHYLSVHGRRRLSYACSAMGIFFCGVLFWSSCQLWHDAWTSKWLSETIWAVPLWIPYASLPIGFGLMLLQYVVGIVTLINPID